MLEALFGSINKKRALVYLIARDEGYARAIAEFWQTGLRNIQVQLAGVLVSRREGRTRLYEFNPRCPQRREMLALLERMLEFYPETERERQFRGARRRQPT